VDLSFAGLSCNTRAVQYAIYSVTHPSYTSNVRPTATILSRYVDEVPVQPWVVCHEHNGRPPFEVANSPPDSVSLSIICAGNGALSVPNRI